MWSVVKMSGILYAMKSVEFFGELHYDENEVERLQEFVNTGVPVIFCGDLDELHTLFSEGAKVEIVASDDDEDDDEDN